jgi:hypothetical protein
VISWKEVVERKGGAAQMQSAHEQRFLREGGLGTITSVLDVPCGFTHHRDEGHDVILRVFGHAVVQTSVALVMVVMVMGLIPQRMHAKPAAKLVTPRAAQIPRALTSQYFDDNYPNARILALRMTTSQLHADIVLSDSSRGAIVAALRLGGSAGEAGARDNAAISSDIGVQMRALHIDRQLTHALC